MNKLYIISGQSGVGKKVIIGAVLKNYPNFQKVVTCTSRPKRVDEEEGRDHFFISQAKFKEMIKSNEFLEYAIVHGIYYGTPLDAIQKILDSNKNAIMEIDVQGFENIKSKIPIVSIFIKYQDGKLDKLVRNRLINDSTRNHSEEDILTRIATAKKEAEYIKYYDYSVVNPEGHPEKAIEEVEGIINKEINV